MIGIVILIGLSVLFWRQYAELAHEYDRNRTGYGILGIGIYIGCYLIAAVVGVLIMYGANPAALGDVGAGLVLEACSILFAAGVTWLVRGLLKKSWEKSGLLGGDSEILDR